MSRLDAVAAVELFLSPPDVRRFGLRILRGQASPPNAESLWPELLAQHADIAILRTPAGGMRMSGCGLPLIHADTLVYWGARLDGRILPAQRNGNATVAPASGDDHAGVVRVATHAFAGYRSHYAANPLLARSAIDAGYAEWAGCLLSADPGTHRTWVARLAGEVVGFASCRLDPATCMAEILLNAVHPDHAGCGIYSDLVRAAMLDASARGMRGVESSTQVWNHAVQKVWTRAGWGPLRSYDTWHINALLDAGAILAERVMAMPADALGTHTMAQAAIHSFGEMLPAQPRLELVVFETLSPGTICYARLRQVTTINGAGILIASLHRTADASPAVLCYVTARPEAD